MSDNIRKAGSPGANDSDTNSRQTRNAKAEQQFSEKMAQFRRVEGEREESLTEENKKQQMGSLFEHMANTKAQQEQFIEKHGLKPQDDKSSSVTPQAATAGNQTPLGASGDTEAELMEWLVDAVKVRINRTNASEAVSLDVSAYLPGTTFTIAKHKNGFDLSFETSTKESAKVLRQQQADLVSRLQNEVDPQLSYNIKVKSA